MITPATGCTLSTCAKKDKCVHYASYQYQLAESDTISIINQDKVTLTGINCPYYLIRTSQNYAYGFKALAGSVPHVNLSRLMYKANLGSKSSYYRYYRGEKGLSPSEQQRFLSVIRTLGGNTAIAFDRYENMTVYVRGTE